MTKPTGTTPPAKRQLPKLEEPGTDVSPPAKKPYEAPVLVEWGTLLDMTRKVGVKGQRDGGKSRNHNRTR